MERGLNELWEGEAGTLLLPLPLVRLMGSAAGALFLAELLEREAGDERWQAYSYARWRREVGLSEYRVKKCAAWCAARDFLQTRTGIVRGVPVTFYRLHLRPFYALLAGLLAAGGGAPGPPGAREAAAWRRAVEREQATPGSS